MRLLKTNIPGCMQLFPDFHEDNRGLFVKTFQIDTYERHGLEIFFAEDYYSLSRNRVLRGLHFQTPPKEHTKIVHCLLGEVYDVVVDLRNNSPAYGGYETFILSEKSCNMVYIPPGCAHGFYVLSEKALVAYKTSAEYSPEYDRGILWNSLDIPWPDQDPVLSERDKRHTAFSDFNSPFHYFDIKG